MRRIHIMTLQALALIAFGGCAEHALPSLAQAETLLSQVQATERGIAGTCVNNHETSPAPETFSPPTREGGQANDGECLVFSIDQGGRRAVSGSRETAFCWR